MPDELTVKQEAFALAYLETGTGAKAYRQVYDVKADTLDSTVWEAASRLLANSKVIARIAEIQARAREMSVFTLIAALEELEDARKLAHKEGQAGAAVAATNSKIKLFGLDKPTRLEHAGKNGGPIKTEGTGERSPALAQLFAKLDGIRARNAAALGEGNEDDKDSEGT